MDHELSRNNASNNSHYNLYEIDIQINQQFSLSCWNVNPTEKSISGFGFLFSDDYFLDSSSFRIIPSINISKEQ